MTSCSSLLSLIYPT